MGVYLPYGFEPLTALHIVERYNTILQEQLDNTMYNDFVDTLSFSVNNPNEFTLKYIPIWNNLRLFINGVFYSKEYYTIDEQLKKITWIFTKDNGGFDLTSDFKYLAVYDLSYTDNYLNNFNDVT